MRGYAFLVAVVALIGAAIFISPASGDTGSAASPIFGITIPPGFRDWKVISVAHEAGSNNDLRVVLGNDIAIKAYRAGVLPYPDGTIIVRLAWKYVPNALNDQIFGRPQSFVAGAPTNIQFDVKDVKKYASTGGWGFAQFENGKPAAASVQATCFPCHARAPKARDFVFTDYAPTP